jgi:hypothetical protein
MTRIFIMSDLWGPIEITHDAHMLRNLNWKSPRLRVVYG